MLQIDKTRLVIYVTSPKNYSDVVDVFFKMLKKHWANCPYNIFFSTNWNNKDYYSLIKYNSNNPNDGWVERTINSLSLISSVYVLLFCDDIFIKGTPDVETLEHILDLMDKYSIDFCRLKQSQKGKKIDNKVNYLPIKMPYARNLQIGIFRTTYLLEELKKHNCSAWEMESIWNSFDNSDKNKYFDNVIGVKKTVIPFIHGIEKGCWIPSSKKKIIKDGIFVNNQRKELTPWQVFVRSVKTMGNRIVPNSLRRIAKRVLKKIGFKFVSTN